MDYLFAQCNTPKVFYRNQLPKNFNAQTIPPFGIFIKKTKKDNQALFSHELVHWHQYQKMGTIIFYLRYACENLILGYDKMPMEMVARKNESVFCQKNYTHCVREGMARTVESPNFRKP